MVETFYHVEPVNDQVLIELEESGNCIGKVIRVGKGQECPKCESEVGAIKKGDLVLIPESTEKSVRFVNNQCIVSISNILAILTEKKK